jgi:hypothetical protein
MLIESWLSNYEKHGSACLPNNWQEIMMNDAPSTEPPPERVKVKYPAKSKSNRKPKS